MHLWEGWIHKHARATLREDPNRSLSTIWRGHLIFFNYLETKVYYCCTRPLNGDDQMPCRSPASPPEYVLRSALEALEPRVFLSASVKPLDLTGSPVYSSLPPGIVISPYPVVPAQSNQIVTGTLLLGFVSPPANEPFGPPTGLAVEQVAAVAPPSIVTGSAAPGISFGQPSIAGSLNSTDLIDQVSA